MLPALKPIKRIAVIGAGPSAAGFGKALLQEGIFDQITLFERRSDFGGLWNYSKDKANDPTKAIVPSDSPFVPKDGNSPYESPLKRDNEYVWPSAVYSELDTNIPKDLMAYNNFPFDSNLPLYPSHKDVLHYLRKYSEEVRPITRFNTKVVKVEYVNGESTQTPKFLSDISFTDYYWKVTSRPIVPETNGGLQPSLKQEFKDVIEEYDAVAVASGNYDTPFIPDFPGLEEWNLRYPHSIVHAKFYDSFKDFTKKDKILIVGNSASGADIAYQLALRLDIPIYKSKRSENLQPAGSHPLIKDLPNIKEFKPETMEIVFVDGLSIKGFTKIIFATGYLKAFPYLESLSLPYIGSFKSTVESIKQKKIQPIVSSGFKLNGFYQHVLSYQYPGLAVIGAPKYVLPTRLSETQGAWMSRVWSDRVKLPSKEEMMKWELERYNEVEGNEYRFHSIPYPLDVEYYTFLNNQILASGKGGLIPVIWDEKKKKIREHVKEIKEAYIKYKQDKNELAYSLDQLEKAGYLNYDAKK